LTPVYGRIRYDPNPRYISIAYGLQKQASHEWYFPLSTQLSTQLSTRGIVAHVW
jgi:hypothetical protein